MVYSQLGRLGVMVPEDIFLISFGSTHWRSAILRCLTSGAVDEVEIGHRAAKLPNEMRDGQRPIEDQEQIIMPLVLTEGQTLGPVLDSRSTPIEPTSQHNRFK